MSAGSPKADSVQQLLILRTKNNTVYCDYTSRVLKMQDTSNNNFTTFL